MLGQNNPDINIEGVFLYVSKLLYNSSADLWEKGGKVAFLYAKKYYSQFRHSITRDELRSLTI